MLTSTCVTSDLYFGTLIIWINKLVSPGKVNTDAVFGSNGEEGFKTNLLLYSYNLSCWIVRKVI